MTGISRYVGTVHWLSQLFPHSWFSQNTVCWLRCCLPVFTERRQVVIFAVVNPKLSESGSKKIKRTSFFYAEPQKQTKKSYNNQMIHSTLPSISHIPSKPSRQMKTADTFKEACERLLERLTQQSYSWCWLTEQWTGNKYMCVPFYNHLATVTHWTVNRKQKYVCPIL